MFDTYAWIEFFKGTSDGNKIDIDIKTTTIAGKINFERKKSIAEIRKCLIDGRFIVHRMIKGEMRYGKLVELKNRKIVVIYVIDKSDEEKIITCYPMKKK